MFPSLLYLCTFFIFRSTPYRIRQSSFTRRVDDIDKLRLERGTADEEAVHVRLSGYHIISTQIPLNQKVKEKKRTQLFRVRSSDGTTVDNPRSISDLSVDGLFQVSTNISVGFLCLGGGGDFARSNRPHRFVRDHDFPTQSQTHSVHQSLDKPNKHEENKTHFQSSALSASTTGFSCAWTTWAVWFASRSARVSPTQRMTERPSSSAARVFWAMRSEVSWKRVRRSEWPRMT